MNNGKAVALDKVTKEKILLLIDDEDLQPLVDLYNTIYNWPNTSTFVVLPKKYNA